MKNKIPFLLLFILLFSNLTFAEANSLPEVNFTEGYIIAEGMGVVREDIANQSQAIALARLAAKVDAQRNLLEIIAGLEINGQTSLKNLMIDDEVRTHVEGILQGAQVVPNEEYLQEGIYHIQLKVSFEPLKTIYASSPASDESTEQTDKKNQYTSLIIDAQQFKITTIELLQIRDLDDKLIFSPDRAPYTGEESILKLSHTDALSDPRAGENPLIISAQNLNSIYNLIIYITQEDGQTILSQLGDTDIFLMSKILIITGGKTNES
ncbi:MAG: hypothetical protein KAX49_00390 [Halanaerobiales bacterium]|nr:hypothetical protein [Halanaerobiales bacterium]